ncbi:UNVERIFIED_CONTAM: hypothetical protein K2H54_057542 [Gekko kuhli]
MLRDEWRRGCHHPYDYWGSGTGDDGGSSDDGSSSDNGTGDGECGNHPEINGNSPVLHTEGPKLFGWGALHPPHPFPLQLPVPLRWAHFNLLLTEETYVLTQGSQRNSHYDFRVTEDCGFPLPGEMLGQRWVTDRSRDWGDHQSLLEEKDGVDIWLAALKRSQWDQTRPGGGDPGHPRHGDSSAESEA